MCLGACFILHYSIVSLLYYSAPCKYHSDGLIDNDDCFMSVL